jgi:hypothetical protein
MKAIYDLARSESRSHGSCVRRRLKVDWGAEAPGMFVQLAIGTALMLLTILVSALAFWGLEVLLVRSGHWIARPPHRPKLIAVLCMAVFWSFSTVIGGVWIWALAFLGLGIFPTLEASVYFSLVAFTTLGFGDVLLPDDWRLLSGMSGANGLLLFGLMTAMLVEVLRFARIEQESEEDEATAPPHVDHLAEQLRRRRKKHGFFSDPRG